ncbi:MAG TPA: protein kinase [Pyrinomonadaceae bacterium]|nr:protein kinase [Pyrinomonadaceae bacterium]
MLEAGARLGRYEIRSKIGQGGMGEVYLARDTELDRKVALKILPAEVASNQDRMRRFVQEAKAAAALNHPNIAHIYEIGQDSGTNFMAMEFIDGQTLSELMKSRQQNLGKLLRYLQHTAEGLAKAHAAGIVHRDLKPDNIMVTQEGHAKILDFGLAKLLGLQTISGSGTSEVATAILPQHSRPGAVMGTVGYMSPEQAQGDTENIDQRSDIFSFGCILYEAVTGERAFAGKDAIDSLNKIIREPVAPIGELNPLAPADLQRIVRRCLAKDPDERYQNIKDVAIELKDVRRELAGVDTPLPAPVSRAAATSSLSPSTHLVTPSTHVSSAEFIFARLQRHKTAVLLIAVALVIVVATGITGLIMYRHAKTTERAIESIAVLPFANQNKDPEIDYLADGLTESTINSLTQVPNLKVIARTTVFRYKGKEIDPFKAGQEMGVRAVLTGRLQQRGDDLIVSAELLDLRDNKQIWGEQYQRRVSDLLAIQREIAREITNNLRPKLAGKTFTDSAEAYQLYLKGRFYWNRRTPSDFHKAITFFDQAIEKDPNYALAYSGLADSYALLPVYGGAGAPQEWMPQAKAAAMKALALDDNLAEAHASLGQIMSYYDFDFTGADRQFQRAISLNPNYATAHQWRAENLSTLSRFDEAIAEARRAIELDPMSPIINRIYGDCLVDARRFDEAIEQYRKTIEIDPNFATAHYFMARAYEGKGSYDQAVEEFAKATDVSGFTAADLAKMKEAYAKSGRNGYLQVALDVTLENSKKGYVPAFVAAEIYARLGQKDQAFSYLEKSLQERDFRVALIKVSFEFDSLRSDPRFADLLKRIGLPDTPR